MSGGETTSFLEIVIPAWRGEVEAELLEGVEHQRDRRGAVGLDQVADDLVDVALLQRAVDELVLLGVVLVPERLGDRPLDRGR